MSLLDARWVGHLKHHHQTLTPLVARFQDVGKGIESTALVREGQRVAKYLQGVDQLAHCAQRMVQLAQKIKATNAAERESMLDELYELEEAANRIYDRVVDDQPDWELDEYIGHETGLRRRLETIVAEAGSLEVIYENMSV